MIGDARNSLKVATEVRGKLAHTTLMLGDATCEIALDARVEEVVESIELLGRELGLGVRELGLGPRVHGALNDQCK